MGGTTKQVQSTNNTTTQNPFAPTIPGLSSIAGSITSLLGNAAPTATETGALNTLASNAASGNPYAPKIAGLADTLLSGGGPDRSGYATTGYNQLQAGLTPIATQSTDPYSNDAFARATNVMSNDIMDRIKGQYAGAGYTPTSSGDFGYQVGRGISAGVAPAMVDAQNNLVNQRMGATSALYGGGNTTAGLLSGLDQTRLANMETGVGASTAALQARDSAANQALAVEAARRGLPAQGLGSLESLLLPIAQAGGTSNMTGTTTGSTQVPLAQQILGGVIGGTGLLGGTGAFGSGSNPGWLSGLGSSVGSGLGAVGSGVSSGLGSLLGLFASDRTLKTDIQRLGTSETTGLPIYAYRYKGDPKNTPKVVGPMAQDLEEKYPGSTARVGGKMVVLPHAAGLLGAL